MGKIAFREVAQFCSHEFVVYWNILHHCYHNSQFVTTTLCTRLQETEATSLNGFVIKPKLPPLYCTFSISELDVTSTENAKLLFFASMMLKSCLATGCVQMSALAP